MADANISSQINALVADMVNRYGRPAQLKVGILEGATHTDAKGNSIPVAQYAIYNEYGTNRIPSRPFLRTSMDIYHEAAWLPELADQIREGTPTEQALARVGEMAVGDIRETIEDWETPPNAPYTIARKRSRRNDPLVDSGDMVDAMAYDIKMGTPPGGGR